MTKGGLFLNALLNFAQESTLMFVIRRWIALLDLCHDSSLHTSRSGTRNRRKVIDRL